MVALAPYRARLDLWFCNSGPLVRQLDRLRDSQFGNLIKGRPGELHQATLHCLYNNLLTDVYYWPGVWLLLIRRGCGIEVVNSGFEHARRRNLLGLPLSRLIVLQNASAVHDQQALFHTFPYEIFRAYRDASKLKLKKIPRRAGILAAKV